MKKLFYLSLSLCYTLGFSKVITVNNNTNAIGMYNDLQTAIDDALVDDTILVHSSPATYGNIAIRKRLVLIGEGYLTSSDNKAKVTTIGYIVIDSISGGDPVSGTIINGFSTGNSNVINSAGTFLVNRVILKNCKGSGLFVRGNDWEIINCFLTSQIDVSFGFTVTRVEVHNTVLGYFQNFKGGLISNCIFTHNSVAIRTCNFVQVQNCIFTSSNTAIGTDNIAVINSSFTNTPEFLPENSNSCTNCFFGTAPRFVNTTDYQLDSTGPINVLIGAGSDGKDIGVSGGSYSVSKLDGRINLPQVSQVVVKTGVIAPGENLIIEITGRSRK